jgi:negative regulator of sigma E activity
MNTPWSLDTLMAFIDGELDASQRAELERALAADAALRERVDRLRTQRRRVEAAFASVLDEQMPDRLSGLLADAPSRPANVVDIAAERGARAASRRAMSSWAAWGGMAASVAVGVLLGMQLAGRRDASIGLHDGQVTAGGAIERALSTQLAGADAAAPVAVQLSFVDRDGGYCRTFSTASVAGLACRRDGRWAVQTLAAAESKAHGAIRQAASPLPRAVLDAVDARIDGTVLDAQRERQARDQGWLPLR